MTITLFDYIHSELIKEGHNEFVNEQGDLVLFEADSQFIQKVIRYDDEVETIINRLFYDLSLLNDEHDKHFKRHFTLRFANRRINRQTIEAFQIELMNAFMTYESYLNQLYDDLENYILNSNETKQITNQESDGITTSDNRQAYADLPQNNVQLDVNNTVMDSATDNTISRNKQTNQQQSKNDNTMTVRTYQLDNLLKTSTIWENILNAFDEKCFMQTW